MDTLSSFFLDERINLIPQIFWWLMFGAAEVLLFFLQREQISKTIKTVLKLFAAKALLFHILWAAFLSYGQYHVWTRSEMGKALLSFPLPKEASAPVYETLFPFLFTWQKGYYAHYIFGRFWIEALLSAFAAVVFYGLLLFLKKYRERFFREGEVLLGFLCALIVGWPMTVVFIGVSCAFAVIFSVARYVFKRETYTALGMPFVFATAACLLFAQLILKLTSLSVLAM